VKAWLAWLPLTPVARNDSAEALPAGRVMAWPAALTASRARVIGRFYLN
jgi:hypothetical protein